MPYVVTVDQISSRTRPDTVPATMAALTTRFPDAVATRTVGDEFEVLFGSDPVSVVDATLMLMREGGWHVGVGIGTVEEPTPRDLRRARGPAFLAARRAVEEAKDRTYHLRVVTGASDDLVGHDAEVVLALLLSLRSRRSDAGWAAADLAEEGFSQAEIGERLGVTRQAVNQRLQAAQWSLDVEARPAAARLLDRAEQASIEAARA